MFLQLLIGLSVFGGLHRQRLAALTSEPVESSNIGQTVV